MDPLIRIYKKYLILSYCFKITKPFFNLYLYPKGDWGIEVWSSLVFLRPAVKPLPKSGVRLAVRDVQIFSHVRQEWGH